MRYFRPFKIMEKNKININLHLNGLNYTIDY